MRKLLLNSSFLIFIFFFITSIYIGKVIPPNYVTEKVALDIHQEESRYYYYAKNDVKIWIDQFTPLHQSKLHPTTLKETLNQDSEMTEEYIVETTLEGKRYYQIRLKKHWGLWSLMPAFLAIILCWTTKEPLSALFAGIVVGAMILAQYDIVDSVFIPIMMTKGVVGVLILYLWFLGGLLGLWTKTGAAQAFGEFMSKHFVKGPKTAKLVSWFMGVIFFQGGTISTVLVGTTVRPISDKENISHEELAYIVDSTASPIASQLAFNAWPSYVQTFIFVSGVSWLATEADRIAFFFKSVPFCFYAIFAVLGTFLLSIDKSPFVGEKLQKAINRSRTEGKLDATNSQPLYSYDTELCKVPDTYTPHMIDFIVPLAILISVSIGTFIVMGSPKVRWAFGFALLSLMILAAIRGMELKNMISGIHQGLRSVVYGSVILVFAIIIGKVSQQLGGGIYLVYLLGDHIPFWALPVMLQVLTVIISFSTGTSWGTYAVAFPLAMPLAYAVAQSQGLAHPELFMTICFAAVMDGSVFGDQCSPISDTTVLTSICTGCDLMDHVKTQIPQASLAAILAGICWTGVVFFSV